LKSRGVGDAGIDLNEDTFAVRIIARQGELLDLDVAQAIESY